MRSIQQRYEKIPWPRRSKKEMQNAKAMKTYKSKLNIKFSDYAGAIALWCVAIVCTLGFAAIPFQLWLAKVILDNWEIEVHEK